MSILTPPEHEHSAAIDAAAEWLALPPHKQIDRPIVPHIREQFGLSVSEAIEAIREANLRRERAA
ncbi:hypothetical protein [Chelativorans alearense]|uniref:hypothetical protein n=1 Tax=Chelativorans alearense TaxID=2681495 RepID=UPI0013D04A6C|nr:hypothetical protein [Chelativorans alearense]